MSEDGGLPLTVTNAPDGGETIELRFRDGRLVLLTPTQAAMLAGALLGAHGAAVSAKYAATHFAGSLAAAGWKPPGAAN